MLESRVKRQLLEEVQSICPKGVTLMHVRQGQSKGLGHAVLCARPLIGDAPFAVLLPDVLMDDVASDLTKDNLASMIAEFEAHGRSQIMVEPVPEKDVSKYGVVDCHGVAVAPGKSVSMHAIVEKPSQEEAPSNLAVVGRYVLTADIWPLLEKRLMALVAKFSLPML